jgi:coenzyme F420-reducing hydrogenase delta subunit
MKYYCKICNYETCDNAHLSRHFKSNKHIVKSLDTGKVDTKIVTHDNTRVTKMITQ